MGKDQSKGRKTEDSKYSEGEGQGGAFDNLIEKLERPDEWPDPKDDDDEKK